MSNAGAVECHVTILDDVSALKTETAARGANTLNIPLEARGVGAALSPRGHGFRLARSSLFLEADQSIVCSLAGVRLAMEIV